MVRGFAARTERRKSDRAGPTARPVGRGFRGIAYSAFPNGRPPADGYWLSRFGFSAIPGRPRGSGSRPRAFAERSAFRKRVGDRATDPPPAKRNPTVPPIEAPSARDPDPVTLLRQAARKMGFPSAAVPQGPRNSRGAGSATRPGRRSPGFTPGRRGSPVFGIRAYRGLGPRVRQPRPPSRGHSPGPAAEIFTANIGAGQVRWRTVGARGIPTLPGPGRPAHGHSPDGRLPAGVCSAIS